MRDCELLTIECKEREERGERREERGERERRKRGGSEKVKAKG